MNTIAKTVEKARFAAAIAAKETAEAVNTMWSYLRYGFALLRKVLLSKPGATTMAMAAAGTLSSTYNLTLKLAEFTTVTVQSLIVGAAATTVRLTAWAVNTVKKITAKTLRLFKADKAAAVVDGLGAGLKDALLAGITKIDDTSFATIRFMFGAWRSKIVRYPVMLVSATTLAGFAVNTLTSGALVTALTSLGAPSLAMLFAGGLPGLLVFCAIMLGIFGVGLAMHTALAAISAASVTSTQPVVNEDGTQEQIDMLRLTLAEYSDRVAKLEEAFNESVTKLADAIVFKNRVNGANAS